MGTGMATASKSDSERLSTPGMPSARHSRVTSLRGGVESDLHRYDTFGRARKEGEGFEFNGAQSESGEKPY